MGLNRYCAQVYSPEFELNTPGADLGGGCRGCAPLPEMTYGFLIQLVFCKKCGLSVLVTPFLSGAPPPKKNPGSALVHVLQAAI